MIRKEGMPPRVYEPSRPRSTRRKACEGASPTFFVRGIKRFLLQVHTPETETVHSSDGKMLSRGWVCSGFEARRKPGPQLQTGVRRWSEACPGGQAVGKKTCLLQQNRRTNRMGEARSGGTVKRSADCIVIVRWKFNVVGLHLRGGDEQKGRVVLKTFAMLKLGIEYGRCNEPDKRQQGRKRKNNEPRVGFHDRIKCLSIIKSHNISLKIVFFKHMERISEFFNNTFLRKMSFPCGRNPEKLK